MRICLKTVITNFKVNKQERLMLSKLISASFGSHFRSLYQAFAALLTFCALFLSFTSFFGWVFNFPELTLFFYQFIPMSFKSSIAFSLISLAYLFLLLEQKWLVYLFALLSILFCLQVLQFLPLFRWVEEIHPGRPGTAAILAIICLSLAALLIQSRDYSLYFILFPAMAGALIFALSILAVLGMFLGYQGAYSWLDLTQISFRSANCLSLLSLALVSITSHYFRENYPQHYIFWPPLLTALAVLGLFASLYMAYEVNEMIKIRSSNDRKANDLNMLVLKEIKKKLNQVNDFPTLLGISKERLIKRVNKEQDIEGLLLLNSQGEILWKYEKPELSFQQIETKRLLKEQDQPIFPLLAYLVVPTQIDTNSLLFTFIHVEKLIRPLILESWREGADIDIELNDHLIYSIRDTRTVRSYTQTIESHTKTGLIKTTVAITKKTISERYGHLPNLLATSGLLLAFFVGWIFYFFRKFKTLSEELEQADRAQSLFLANVSHEIRTPLHGVITATTLLENSDLDLKQQKSLNVLKFSANDLLQLIDKIFEVSKLELKTIGIKFIPASIQEFFSAEIKKLKPLAEDKGLKLSLNFEGDFANIYLLPISTLHQILFNLVTNAIQFTKEGEINVLVHVKDHFLTFSVADTGIGIPENKQHLIFKKFTQLDKIHNPKTGIGTGIGLYLVKGLVQALNGTVSFKSKLGEGSTFFVTIPLREHKPEF